MQHDGSGTREKSVKKQDMIDAGVIYEWTSAPVFILHILKTIFQRAQRVLSVSLVFLMDYYFFFCKFDGIMEKGNYKTLLVTAKNFAEI